MFSEDLRVDSGTFFARSEVDRRDDWEAVWRDCCRRVRRWRVPPGWSRQQWIEELRAEAAMASVAARGTFRADRNVPFHLYLRMCILGRALARHRAEWRHARRLSALPAVEPEGGGVDDLPGEDLRAALARLSGRDRDLLERLFWKGESELRIAERYGVSQQAISKRKLAVIAALRRRLA